MTINIYRTGYSRYMGRGVWEEFYTDWTASKYQADVQFEELSELFGTFSEYVVKKVEKSSLEINMELIPHLRLLCEIEQKGIEDRMIAMRNFFNELAKLEEGEG